MATPGIPGPERPRIRLASPEEARRKELDRHIQSVIDLIRRSRLTIDQAITDLFREIGFNKYPPKTQQDWRRDIAEGVEKLLQPGPLENK